MNDSNDTARVLREARHFMHFLMIIIAILAASLVAVTFLPRKCPDVASARLERHCMFVRLTLEQELDNLFRTDPQHQMMGRLSFEQLENEDWREVALCAPEGVEIAQGCATGDTSCMAAAVTRALAAMGAR